MMDYDCSHAVSRDELESMMTFELNTDTDQQVSFFFDFPSDDPTTFDPPESDRTAAEDRMEYMEALEDLDASEWIRVVSPNYEL